MRYKGLVFVGVVLAACSPDFNAPDVLILERPSAVAFSCYGNMRVTEGAAATVDQEIINTAQPFAACAARLREEDAPGQQTLENSTVQDPDVVAFVLQPTNGTMAVVQYPAASNGPEFAAVSDSDPLTPGKNAIPVGTLPVGLSTTSDGCHVVVANAGSCDLSVLDANSVLEPFVPPVITRTQVTNASAEPILARPYSMVGEPASGEDTVGFTCDPDPQGVVYISYPSCHRIAAVDPGTGQVVASISFDMDGTATIGDGGFSCDAECGDGALAQARGPLDDPIARPVAMFLDGDNDRLYVGADNNNRVTIVELDTDRLPVSVQQVEVEGEVGLTALTASPDIQMGGALGMFEAGGSGGTKRFVYAVATDGTVRVVEVGGQLVECDTQVDPRYLGAETNVGFLTCMPVGDVGTPPRRPGSTSPGIRLPRDSVPLDVAIVGLDNGGLQVTGDPDPRQMVGYFAFITSSDGFVWVVNVDDDKYPDFENVSAPMDVHLPLALSHQVRDFVSFRNSVDLATGDPLEPVCEFPDDLATERGPRLAEPLTQTLDTDEISTSKLHLLPFVRGVECKPSFLANELEFAAPVAIREAAFQDVHLVRNETWAIEWEGPVSRDSGISLIDGSPFRVGYFEFGGEFSFHEDGAPFCSMGTQPYDIMRLSGCDPTFGDAQCGIGYECYVHPDTPTSVNNGVCLRSDRIDVLSGTCRDFLVARKRYSIAEAYKDRLVLEPRRRMLRTTPINGCTDNDQCAVHYDIERSLAISEQPINLTLDPADPAYTWSCESDPSRAPGVNRCLMTCDTSDDCEPGWACDGGYCVEGVIPPAACLEALHRVRVHVGDAFSMVGSVTGFLHNTVADETTGECIESPTPNPLHVGRVPLSAPPCVGDGPDDLSPNPCSTAVDHSQVFVPPYVFDGEACAIEEDDQGNTFVSRLRTSERSAIRVDNQAVRFHLVDPTTQGDLNCVGDLAGEAEPFAAVFPGYQIDISLTGGFFPMFVTNLSLAYPIDISLGPDGGIWVLDQGDIAGASLGQAIRLIPSAAGAEFAPAVLR